MNRDKEKEFSYLERRIDELDRFKMNIVRNYLPNDMRVSLFKVIDDEIAQCQVLKNKLLIS